MIKSYQHKGYIMNVYHKAVYAALKAYYPKFNWQPVQDGSHPETWQALQEAYDWSKYDGTPLPINGVSDSRNLYGSWGGNVMFRAWHDAVHIGLGVGFDFDGELRVALEQRRQLKVLGFADYVADAIYLDVMSQVHYYERYGKFVVDQLEFTNRVRKHGLLTAVRMGEV